jgi:hypothetical protein
VSDNSLDQSIIHWQTIFTANSTAQAEFILQLLRDHQIPAHQEPTGDVFQRDEAEVFAIQVPEVLVDMARQALTSTGEILWPRNPSVTTVEEP